MSDRRRPLTKRDKLMLQSWRFYLDRYGRRKGRRCRCDYCTRIHRRLPPGARPWEAEADPAEYPPGA